MIERILLASAVVVAFSGVAGLAWPRGSRTGQGVSVALYLLGTCLGFAATLCGLLAGGGHGLRIDWPIAGETMVQADMISLVFLLPLFLVGSLGAIYGLEYWGVHHRADTARKLRAFYGTMTAGMILLLVAGNSILFLVGWEFMAISAFFCVTTEDRLGSAREAGWIYILSAHVGTLLLFGLFGLLHSATGSFVLAPIDAGALSPRTTNGIFLLALGAFGLKAGLMPLHFWLPTAHASAPSHVSAFMSGVLIKMGVYGMVRVSSFFEQPPLWWGETVFALGVVSGIGGVLFAIGQHDIKRLLAYHSIENIGIIFMGLGLALAGKSLDRDDWVLLGLAACLLHVWNHGLFKSLLFLSAGSAIHATHTREIDRLGGLAARMPATAFHFLVGAVAICGLPPLNGFVSELFLYIGMFRAADRAGSLAWSGGLWGPGALALIGALALACFVKCLGAAFLGQPRTQAAATCCESGPAMVWPMRILSGCCLAIGILPMFLAEPLGLAARAWDSSLSPAASAFAPYVDLRWIGGAAAGVFALAAAGVVLFRRRTLAAAHASAGTWDCGYAMPRETMQYTASSFGDSLVRCFQWILLPREKAAKCEGPFPAPAAFHSSVPDVVLDRVAAPAFSAVAWLFGWARALQVGYSQLYVLYILATVLGLLYWIG